MLARNLVLSIAGSLLFLPILTDRAGAADKGGEALKKDVLKAVERLMDKKLQDFRSELLDDIRAMLEKSRRPDQLRESKPRIERHEVQVVPGPGKGREKVERRVVILGEPGCGCGKDGQPCPGEGRQQKRTVRILRDGKEVEAEVELEVEPHQTQRRQGAFQFHSSDGKSLTLRLDGDGKARIVILRDGEEIEREVPLAGLPRVLKGLEGLVPEGVDIEEMLEKLLRGQGGGEGGRFVEGRKGMPQVEELLKRLHEDGAPKVRELLERLHEEGAPRLWEFPKRRKGEGLSPEMPRPPARERRQAEPGRDGDGMNGMWERLRAEKEELRSELDELKRLVKKLLEKKKTGRR